MSNSTARPTRRRLDAKARRQELLAAGATLFATQLYDEVWVDDLARTAGISRGLLYHYFGNKRGFFAAVVEHEAAAMLHATDPDPQLPLHQRLPAVLDAYLDHIQQHPHGYRAIHRGAVSSDSTIRAIVDRNLTQQEHRILHALTGDHPPPEPLRLAVHGWLAFLIAVSLDWLDNPTLDRTTLRDLCVNTLTGAITAALGQPPPASTEGGPSHSG